MMVWSIDKIKAFNLIQIIPPPFIFMKFHSLMIIFKRRQEAFYIYLIYSHYIGLPNPNIGRESSYYWALKYAIHDFYWYRRVAKYQHLTSTIDELIKKYGGNIKVHDNMNKLKISEKFYNTEILNDRVGHDKMNLFAMELFCGYIFCIKATELMKFEENYFDDFFRSFETELQASLKKRDNQANSLSSNGNNNNKIEMHLENFSYNQRQIVLLDKMYKPLKFLKMNFDLNFYSSMQAKNKDIKRDGNLRTVMKTLITLLYKLKKYCPGPGGNRLVAKNSDLAYNSVDYHVDQFMRIIIDILGHFDGHATFCGITRGMIKSWND